MEWTPLLLLFVFRTLRRPDWSNASTLGLFMAMTFLTSLYHAMFAAATATVLLLAGGLPLKMSQLRVRHLKAALIAIGVFAIVAGWLLFGIISSLSSESYLGNHNSLIFSADLESAFVPNTTNLLSTYIHRCSLWTGSQWETAAYIGYAPLLLAAIASWRSRLARSFMAVAVTGALLALGPVLHIGGALYPNIIMPDGLAEALFPSLKMSGLPVRFAWMTTLGVSVAAGIGATFIANRNRHGRLVVVVLATIGLAEHWPKPLIVTTMSRPAILAELGNTPGDWAVLDTTSWSRQLWNQMNHKHPIIGGYLSRVPSSRWHAVSDDPVLAAFVPRPVGIQADRLSEPSKALARLRELQIRFIIMDVSRVGLISSLDLVRRYQDEEMAVFEVPS
jgi:hypothetical protein